MGWFTGNYYHLSKIEMNILEKICNSKQQEINKLKSTITYKDKIEIKKRRGFLDNLIKKNKKNYNLIAEIKKASPSKGEICKNFKLEQIASDYEQAGASCLSVLTEKNFFSGDISFINQVKKIVKIPVLRKDFIIDEWQIYESYYHGADCILLILAILDDENARRFYYLAKELCLDVIVEVHDIYELRRAVKLKSSCIGINNRNLKTLKIDINTFKNLSQEIPHDIIKICESGISQNMELKDLTKYGANAFLVGESLMSSKDIKSATTKLIKR